jgi:hypothetical protein
MSRALVILNSKADRQKVANWAMKLPSGTRVEFKEAKRTSDQNAKMWSCLSDVATQVRYHGIKLSADDYKLLFLDALKREVRMVPNIDGTGFVSLGRSSSDLSKAEMADLITLIIEWGERNGVQFHDDREVAA